MEKRGGAREATDDNIIGRMRVACWITEATDTVYVILLLHGANAYVTTPQC